MAAITAQLKRAFISWLKIKSAKGEAAPTLRASIEDYLVERVEDVSTGQVQTSASGNGFSGTFSSPVPAMLGGFSATEIAAMAQELLEVHDAAKDFLEDCWTRGLDPDEVNQDGWPSPLPAATVSINKSDDELREAYAVQMQYMLPTVSECRHDYSSVRMAGQGVWVQ